MHVASGRRVAIIGAGPSGLAACKAALEEGLCPTIFERAACVGGVWREGSGGKVWNSLHMNLSKFTCSFSDAPWPSHVEAFPGAGEVRKYLHGFAVSNSPLRYVRFCANVTSVAPASGGDGRWHVAWDVAVGDGGDGVSASGAGAKEEELFDFVIIASGIFETPIRDSLPGTEGFRGRVLHAADYRDPSELRDLRVLVVGGAFSGGDIAAEMAKTAKCVTIATRRRFWYLPKHVNGRPLDLVSYSRASHQRNQLMTEEERKAARHSWCASIAGDLPPGLTAPDSQDLPYISVSDNFPAAVRAGDVAVKEMAVTRLEGGSAVFTDGSVEDFDVVVLATGFRLELPFLWKEGLGHLEFDPHDLLKPAILHESVWRPELPGMAFVGIYRGPYFGVMELQARWACGVFSGRLPAPTDDEMRAGLDAERRIRAARPRPQFPHGDYVGMIESLARRVGVHPDPVLHDDADPLRTLLDDGPLLPFHYRLVGFCANRKIAEQAILECATAYPA